MAIAKIFDEKTGITIEYHINDRLKNSLDKKVIPSLHTKDKDFVICVDGREGCSPKGSKVMLSDGSWKNIEDIKIGDEIISPQEDGTNKFSKIITLFNFKSENIYDVCELHRQKRKLYSCSGNHYIPINKKDEKTKKWKIVHYQAQDFFKKSNRDFHNTTTPTCFAIEKFKNKENCKIEPYTFGVWLGDGHFSSKKRKKENPKFNKQTIVKGHWRNLKSGKIWQREHPKKWNNPEFLNFNNRGVGITTNDFKIIEEISKIYPIMNITQKKDANCKTYRFSLNGELAKLLSLYNLEGKGSGNKFIPKEALTSDIEYRKKLLAGLIDTDGYLSKNCSYSITTKSEQLAKDIEYLVYSLGGRCAIRKIKKGIKRTGFIGEYFCVSFYLGNINIPMLLKRKQRDKQFFYLSANRTSIKLKKRDGEQVYGFTVDSPSHWYITDNYVITKNSGKTTFALQLGKYIDPTLNLSRIVFAPDDFRQAVLNAKKGQCIIYDEAFTGFSSRASLSPINRVLVSLSMQMRQKNLF
ncbi:MAG TPA: Hint domain-containing homing endonuclease, partial [Candidatus Paceibacterota bacterium]|nr:Hint domain-containing homing endonuclease [Candidatus Paceibacterota bacterium]